MVSDVAVECASAESQAGFLPTQKGTKQTEVRTNLAVFALSPLSRIALASRPYFRRSALVGDGDHNPPDVTFVVKQRERGVDLPAFPITGE